MTITEDTKVHCVTTSRHGNSFTCVSVYVHTCVYCHFQVIVNADISKKLKSSFFNHYVLKQTAQLLLAEPDGGDDEEEVTCGQVAFQFLLRLCTDFQCGICYKSKQPPGGLER